MNSRRRNTTPVCVLVFLLMHLGKSALGGDPLMSKMTFYLSSTTLDDMKKVDASDLTNISEYQLLNNLTRPLLSIDSDGNYGYDLAESIALSNDGTVADIKLRPAKFSDGSPITAADLAQTIIRLIVRGSSHTQPKEFLVGAEKVKKLGDSCAGIRVLSELHLQLQFKRPLADLFYYLQLAEYGVLHPKQWSKNAPLTFDDYDISSGPYQARRGPDGLRQIELNKKYADAAEIAQHIEKVRFRKVSSPEELYREMRAGNINLGTIGFRDYLGLSKDHSDIFNTHTFNGSVHGSVATVVLNATKGPFKDIRARRWFQRQIFDRLKVPLHYRGLLDKAYEYFLPEAPGFVPVAHVQETVKASACDETLSPAPPFRLIGSTAVQNYLPPDVEVIIREAIGSSDKYKIEFRGTSADFLERKRTRDFDALFWVASMSLKSPNEPLNLLYTSPQPLATDPTGKITELVKQSAHTLDVATRAGLMKKVIEQMTADAEVIPMFYQGYFKFFDKKVFDASNVSFWESNQFYKYRLR